MRFRPWERIPFSLRWHELDSQDALLFGDDSSRALIFRTRMSQMENFPDTVTLRYAWLDRLDQHHEIELPLDRPIGRRLREFVGAQAVAVAIPRIRWAKRSWFRSTPTKILNPGEYTLDGSNIVEYAKARLMGERPLLATSTQRRDAALARVEEIRTEYGELLSDVVYRIDYPALFDVAVPATEQFNIALVKLENPDSLSLKDLEYLVNDLEICYSMARDNAETVGQRHLPAEARADARRAAKAARLAENAGTEGERAASMAQVRRILESLALYYLPTIGEDPKEISR